MTDPRRADKATPSHEAPAAGSRELSNLRAIDAPLVEFVKAGGFLGFSPRQMFPESAV